MKQNYRIIVLAKQVPDTRNVGRDAMTEEGTVNRAALPAIFNPEDLNALELALQIKDEYEGSEVKMLTMGPPRAAEIVREGLYRGADDGVLLNCKNRIMKALNGNENVSVRVNRPRKLAVIRCEKDMSPEIFLDCISKLGYNATLIKQTP